VTGRCSRARFWAACTTSTRAPPEGLPCQGQPGRRLNSLRYTPPNRHRDPDIPGIVLLGAGGPPQRRSSTSALLVRSVAERGIAGSSTLAHRDRGILLGDELGRSLVTAGTCMRAIAIWLVARLSTCTQAMGPCRDRASPGLGFIRHGVLRQRDRSPECATSRRRIEA
jgi:hypothetical protein